MIKKLFCVLICLISAVCSAAPKTGHTMILGANVNHVTSALEPELLERSCTSHVRAFIPASPFILGKSDVKTAGNVQTLKRTADSGLNVVLCLKWDFERANWRVPKPDSLQERQCFDWVDALLEEMNGNVYVLETINEVTIDTIPADLEPDAGGTIPVVRFLQRLVKHVRQTDVGKSLPIYSGGFTRLDLPRMQKRPVVPALLDWIETDPQVTGANFHIHGSEFECYERSLKYIRTKVKQKPYVVTEFSLVWVYKSNLTNKLASDESGKRFIERYGLDDELTVRDYVNQAIRNPVPEQQWNAFLVSQDWYDTGFLLDAAGIMEKYGVVVATFAFQQASSGGRALLRADSTPWILNPIYVNKTARTDSSDAAVNRTFFRDYLQWQQSHRILQSK